MCKIVLSGNRLLLFIFYLQKYLQSQLCPSEPEFYTVYLRSLKPPLNSSHIWLKNQRRSRKMQEMSVIVWSEYHSGLHRLLTWVETEIQPVIHSPSHVPPSGIMSTLKKGAPFANSHKSHVGSPVPFFPQLSKTWASFQRYLLRDGFVPFNLHLLLQPWLSQKLP